MRRRRSLALLAVFGFVLGFAAAPATNAQEGQRDLSESFGGYIVSGRGNGFQMTYDSPGLLPVGSPIFQLSVPEALATMSTGPTGYALGSFAYPGPLVADLGAALAQSGGEGGQIPPYPIRSEAFYPAGPTEASSGDGGTEMTAVTKFADSSASLSAYSGLDFSPAITVGGARATARTVVEGDQIVTRSRAEVSDINVLAGILTIESVVTDLVAVSNGSASDSAGRTVVSGAAVLGRPATIDGRGITLNEEPEGGGEDATGGALDPLGGVLDPVVGGAAPAVDPLNALLEQVGGGGDKALQVLFEQAGIKVELLDPIASSEAGTAERTANGLKIDVIYEGKSTPVLTDLINLVPSENLPADNLGPIPFSPQALFNLLKETHINGIALAPANVYVAATPAFVFPKFDFPAPTNPPVASPPTGTRDAAVAAPQLPGRPTSGPIASPATPDVAVPTGVTVTGAPVTSRRGIRLGEAIPAFLIIALVALGGPFFAFGSTKLADNVLQPVSTSCPEGLDRATNKGSRV